MASTISSTTGSNPNEMLALVHRGFDVVEAAAQHAAESFAHADAEAPQKVSECERELDRLDREFDERLAPVLATVAADQIPELLAGLKLIIDLERIADLLLSAVTTGNAVADKLEMEEISDFIKMCTILEQMLVDVHSAFRKRDLKLATSVLRADSEIDRRRNLIVIRHLEGATGSGPHSIHVVSIAQSIERAGDHATNLAEEIAHLCSGHSLRHAMRRLDKCDEQMFIEHMRRHYEGEK